MTSPNEGKKDTRIQKREEAAKQGNFIDLEAHAKGICILLTSGLTIFLAWRNQYLYALCAACLTLAAVTCDRLKKMRIGLKGIQSEWGDSGSRRSRKGSHSGQSG